MMPSMVPRMVGIKGMGEAVTGTVVVIVGGVAAAVIQIKVV